MLKSKMKKIAGVASAVVVTSVLTVGSASAAVDVSPIVDSVADVITVGGAIISVLGAVAGVKYIRKAF